MVHTSAVKAVLDVFFSLSLLFTDMVQLLLMELQLSCLELHFLFLQQQGLHWSSLQLKMPWWLCTLTAQHSLYRSGLPDV